MSAVAIVSITDQMGDQTLRAKPGDVPVLGEQFGQGQPIGGYDAVKPRQHGSTWRDVIWKRTRASNTGRSAGLSDAWAPLDARLTGSISPTFVDCAVGSEAG